MSEINKEVLDILFAITERKPIDWKAFDEVLANIDDINKNDDAFDETYYTDCLCNAAYYISDEDIEEMTLHFLRYGYDVRAHDGRNGGLALSELCSLEYDRNGINAAKLLLKAGAPIEYPSTEETPDEAGVLGTIDWMQSGAWVVYKEYSRANILLALQQIMEAVKEGKPYEAIDSYHVCIGKSLERITVIGEHHLTNDQELNYFDENLVLWFDGCPLVVRNCIDFVVNPYTVEENINRSVDVSDAYTSLIGASLEAITYINQVTCYLDFDNGKRLVMTSIAKDGSEDRKGVFELRNQEKVDLNEFMIDSVFRWNDGRYVHDCNSLREEALSLTMGETAILIYTKEIEYGRYCIEAITCSTALLKEFDIPLISKRDATVKILYNSDYPDSIQFVCENQYLSVQTYDEPGFRVEINKVC